MKIGFCARFYFAQLFIFFSELRIIFFAHFQQNGYFSLVIDNVYFVISS